MEPWPPKPTWPPEEPRKMDIDDVWQMKDPWQMTASEVLQMIRERKLTIEEITRSLLARVDECEERIRAWVHINKVQVIQQAIELDQVPFNRRSLIHGLPIGIKDIMLTKDMPTQYNSRLFESNVPIGMDAAPVATLRQYGALIFGKLTTTEFATSKQGDWHQNHTLNPFDRERTPGGSSSGSGAAVADLQIPIATGTQTGGSIIRPASFNGVFGWKPTWNVISREGLAQWSVTMDTCGFFARSVDDLELMAEVFRLHQDKSVRPFSVSGANIALCRTHNWHKAGKGTIEAMDVAKDLLSKHGANVHDLELPSDFAHAIDWHAIILASEGRSSFLGQYLTSSALLHESIRGYVEREITEKEILEAYDGLAALRPIWDKIAAQYDAILTPSVPDKAPRGLSDTGDMSFCSMWTALHVPALHIPFHRSFRGMPIGLTLVGARLTDRRLMSTGKLLAEVLNP